MYGHYVNLWIRDYAQIACILSTEFFISKTHQFYSISDSEYVWYYRTRSVMQTGCKIITINYAVNFKKVLNVENWHKFALF